MTLTTNPDCFTLKMTPEFDATMRGLAGWYAGHMVPSAHHVSVEPAFVTINRTTGEAAVTWNVYDRHSIVVGDVTWNEASAVNGGWDYSIRF